MVLISGLRRSLKTPDLRAPIFPTIVGLMRINIEHAWRTFRKTCETEHEQPYRRFTSRTPYYKWIIEQARPTNVFHASRSMRSNVTDKTSRFTTDTAVLLIVNTEYSVPNKHGRRQFCGSSTKLNVRQNEFRRVAKVGGSTMVIRWLISHQLIMITTGIRIERWVS